MSMVDLGVAPVPAAVQRVALISVHTCPLDQPGTGDSGGMNVVIRQVARRLAEMGVRVDIFSRWSGVAQRVREMDPGVRVIHLEAGPAAPIPKEDLSRHLDEFVASLVQFESSEGARLGVAGRVYDAVHTHYWLSGRVGRALAQRWRVPWIHSSHTLGRVKNLTLAPGDRPEPDERIEAEAEIARSAGCILAPTPEEAAELVSLYGAPADRVQVVSPGVDTDVFTPAETDVRVAKRALGLRDRPLVLFVGRLQPLKAPDVALRAVARLAVERPDLDLSLLVLGGPSGRGGITPSALRSLAAELGVADRLVLRLPVPHGRLPDYYRAADVVIVPSRSESFGLVALEAAACGTPVVASCVGGLQTAVRHGLTGLLVAPADDAAFARALATLLDDAVRRSSLGGAGARFARRYDWRRSAARLLAVYETHAGQDMREGSMRPCTPLVLRPGLVAPRAGVGFREAERG